MKGQPKVANVNLIPYCLSCWVSVCQSKCLCQCPVEGKTLYLLLLKQSKFIIRNWALMLNHCTVTSPNPFKKTGHVKEERLSYVSYCSVLFWEIKLTMLHLEIMKYCWVNKEVHFKVRACSHLDRNPVIVLYIFTLR